MKKNNLLRVSGEIAIFVVTLMAALFIFNSDTMMADTNPLSFLVLIPLKMSLAVLHWFMFRKIMQNWLPSVNWTIKVKDMDANTLLSVVSFIMFALAYTSYS